MTATVNEVVSGTTNITDFGTYTPTFTAVTGSPTGAPTVAQYLRVGDTVTVSGMVDVSSTLVESTYELSLPIASNFSNIFDCAGCGIATTLDIVDIVASTVNNKSLFHSLQGIGGVFAYTYTYRVI